MQKGRSMIEMLGVLVIMTVLTITALAGWKHMREKMDVDETQNEIALIEQDISNLFNWSRGYPDALSMETLCVEKVFPSGCVKSGGDYVAYHPLDRNVPEHPGVYSVYFYDGYLVIELESLPNDKICHEILDSVSELEHFVEAVGDDENDPDLASECSGTIENTVTLTLIFQ